MSDTLKELQQLIAQRFALPLEELDPDKPMEAFGMDSLSLIELMFTLEDHFHFSFPNGDPKVSTLRGLAALVDELRLSSSTKSVAQ